MSWHWLHSFSVGRLAALQGVLSYVILRPVMTAAGFIAQLCGVYGDGQLRFDRVYLYTVLVSNFSQAST